jgi:ubiquitin-conjugating enzyme E2 J2
MTTTIATRRLQRELVALQKEAPPFVRARPSDADMLSWYYVLEGPPGTPYEGGHFCGTVTFPPTYPMAPPAVRMLTPSGRFAVGYRICMTMTDYHPESWNPLWSVATLLVGLLSFMMDDNDRSVGYAPGTADEKRAFATASLAYNVGHVRGFSALFPELAELAAERKKAAAAADAAAAAAAAAQAAHAAAAAGAAQAAPAPAAKKARVDAAVDPRQMFRGDAAYSQWDADGVPTADAAGAPLSGAARQALRRRWVTQEKRWLEHGARD